MPFNPIHQFVSSLKKVTDQSYLIVLQHSLQQRHVMASETADGDLYEKAQVRTPAENARRDFVSGVAWLQYLAYEFQKTHAGLVWVSTTTDAVSFDTSFENVTEINVASNPFGWDEEEQEEYLTLEDLPRLLDAIQTAIEVNRRPIVIESLTPILMRHGLSRTLAWLRRLEKFQVPVVCPILVELLTPVQHQVLEDMAQAVFYLQGGNMTMIRQGVRERGNVIRETIDFDIEVKNGVVSIQVLIPDEKEAAKDETKEAPVSTPKKTAPVGRPEKVQLQLEEDDAPREATKEEQNRPRIYVEDDDPEFDDMDEEDPDDDLDI